MRSSGSLYWGGDKAEKTECGKLASVNCLQSSKLMSQDSRRKEWIPLLSFLLLLLMSYYLYWREFLTVYAVCIIDVNEY